MTVKNLMFRFLSRVDPSLKAGTALDFTGGGSDNTSTWASTGGERFSAARAIDIYNEGRMALFNAISSSVDPIEKSKLLASLVVMSRILFALQTNESYYYVAAPTGYVEAISLFDAYKNEIIQILPSRMVDINKAAINARYQGVAHSSSVVGRRYVFEHNAGFVDYDGYCFLTNMAGTGTAALANASATITGIGSNWTTKNLAGATIKVGAHAALTVNSVSAVTTATASTTASSDISTTTYYVSNLQLTYYRLTDITSAMITGATEVEPYEEYMLPILVELMVAIANEQGMIEVDALAKKLLAITGKTRK